MEHERSEGPRESPGSSREPAPIGPLLTFHPTVQSAQPISQHRAGSFYLDPKTARTIGYIALLVAAVVCGVAGYVVASDYSHSSVSDPNPHGDEVSIDHPDWDHFGPGIYSLAMAGIVPFLIFLDRRFDKRGLSVIAGASMVPVAGIWSYWGALGGNLILLLSALAIALLLLAREGRGSLDVMVASVAAAVAALAAGLCMSVGFQDIYWFGINEQVVFDPTTLEYIRTEVTERDLHYVIQGQVAISIGVVSYCILAIAILRRLEYLIALPGVFTMYVGYVDLAKELSINFFGPFLLVVGAITILSSLSGRLVIHPDRGKGGLDDPYGNPP